MNKENEPLLVDALRQMNTTIRAQETRMIEMLREAECKLTVIADNTKDLEVAKSIAKTALDNMALLSVGRKAI